MEESLTEKGRLCMVCTHFIDKISDIPNPFQYGVEKFATCAEIEATASTCTFCKLFWSSIQNTEPNPDSDVTLRIHWLVSKPGPTLIMMGTPPKDTSPDVYVTKLLSAQDVYTGMPLRRRYLISYVKGKIQLVLQMYVFAFLRLFSIELEAST